MGVDIVVRGQKYYLEVLVTDANSKGETGLNVDYKIFRSADDVSTISGSLVDVGRGVYKEDVTFSELGQHRIIYELPIGYLDAAQSVMVIEEAVDTTVQAIKEAVDFIKDIEGGKWEIINNQMIFYASDNEIVVARFNLFDEAGKPSMINVFRRERV